MAAGMGTRMRSRTAKVLHALAGVPLIRYPLRMLAALGAQPLIVIVGHQAEEVIAACGGFGAGFAHQREPRGTGHAVQCADQLRDFAGDLLILPSDLPLLRPETLRALVDAHRSSDAALSLLTATVAEPHGYGRIVRDHGRIARVVEQRDAGPAEDSIREINVGVYCAEAAFLFPALDRLEPNNAQGELYLTDIVAQAAAAGRIIADASVVEGDVAQVSSREDLADVERTLRLRLARHWMTEGVTLEDPETAYIGPDVVIGRDTVIGPNVTLRGRTQLGSDCRLDGSTRIVDSIVGNGVNIKFGVVAAEARIGDRCVVGPFAQLRPGTHLAAEVHIGDFVETKNAIIGTGTKANHLAYIGDAEIGRDANVGAGTITCNYDGFRKHRTIIGDRVQIGSDSQLIAPVTVGDDAYIATATTVRDDVPAGALAYTTKEQRHRPGWVAARRKREAQPVSPPRNASQPQDRKQSKSAAKRRAVAKLRRPSAGKKRR